MRRNIEHREKNGTHILVQVLGKGKKNLKRKLKMKIKNYKTITRTKKKKIVLGWKFRSARFNNMRPGAF